ncbi:MAG: hypothetical protein ACYDHD_10370 [Vulcanimicrobiaceae bacterium]
MRSIASMTLLALCALIGLPASAGEPAHVTFAPVPPGTVVTSKVVYLAGEAMHSQWRAVLSKRRLGAAYGQTFYQWYLSIYAISGATYHLRYQSPRDGAPLDRVTKADGSPAMWLPVQDASIVGAAELMQPGVQQLVFQSHQTGADCGTANITIFTADGKTGKVVPAVSIENSCELNATIVHGKRGDAVQLTGPYYSPSAALCCPTKPKATATLRYRNGAWVETPKYFTLHPRRFSPM